MGCNKFFYQISPCPDVLDLDVSHATLSEPAAGHTGKKRELPGAEQEQGGETKEKQKSESKKLKTTETTVKDEYEVDALLIISAARLERRARTRPSLFVEQDDS